MDELHWEAINQTRDLRERRARKNDIAKDRKIKIMMESKRDVKVVVEEIG